MRYYITVDGGTTNTRVNLISNGNIIDTKKISLGAKDCINGADMLKSAITGKIDNICLQNSVNKDRIEAVIASGMITSELGLFPLAHLPAPAGIAELHEGMKRAENMFGALPCYFIPGVKKATGDPRTTDMMRGEETEIMGILNEEYGSGLVYILPGSHSKHIFLDSENRISDFKTLLSGETISALASGTILKGTVRLDMRGFDVAALLSGYDAAAELGLGEALFKVRILKNLFGKNDTECYSFFLGAVMRDEVDSLSRSGAKTAVIGGKAELKEPLAYLLREKTAISVVTLSDKVTESATALGAVKIYEHTD